MYQLFSVDDHIIEPPDLWTSRLPSKHVTSGPRVIERDGNQLWAYEDRVNTQIGLNAVAGKPRDQWNIEPARFADMIPGCYDPGLRARDLLSQGVLASVSFPTVPRFAGLLFTDFHDKELADLCVKAWNDYVLDEWCPGGPQGLYVPGIICQLWDPPRARAEIARCAERGARTLFFPENPSWAGLPSLHDGNGYWDPIWSICEEADVALSMHVGSSGYAPAVDPLCSFSAVIACGEVGSMLSLINLVLSDVTHRFPGLKFVLSEGGIGWIPALLHRADRQLDRHSGWVGRLPMKPSEVFARNVWCCMVEEPMGLSFHPHIGATKILCETDYPHADSTFPRTQESFTEVFDGVDPEVVELVSHRNAENVFRWQMTDASHLDDPQIAAWRQALQDDPTAALTLRHEVTGIDQLGSTGTCSQLVNDVAFLMPCGAPLREDGSCTRGHVPVPV